MNRDFKPGCLADIDHRQWRFERTSGLPVGYFDRDAWWKPSQDAIVFWIVVAVGIAAIIWSH